MATNIEITNEVGLRRVPPRVPSLSKYKQLQRRRQDHIRKAIQRSPENCDALKHNVVLMVEKYGLESIGFLTPTFACHVIAYRMAQKALHSLMSGVLKGRYREYNLGGGANPIAPPPTPNRNP